MIRLPFIGRISAPTLTRLCIIGIWLVAFVEILLFIFTKSRGLLFWDDSSTYLKAADVILSGHISSLRTPVYPLICRFFTYFFDYNGLYILAALQTIIVQASTLLIYKSCRKLGCNRFISLVAMVTCSWQSLLTGMNCAILTESLSVAVSALMVWLIVDIITASRPGKSIFCIPPLLFAMIMLRPFFVCFIPAVAIPMIFVVYKHRHLLKGVAVSATVSAALLLSYCGLMKAEHGRFQITTVSEVNRAYQLYHLLQADTIYATPFTQSYSNPTLHSDGIFLDEYWVWEPTPRQLQLIDSTYHARRNEILKVQLNHFSQRFIPQKTTRIDILWKYVNPSHISPMFNYSLIFIIIELLIFIRRRRTPGFILSISLVGITFGTIFTVYYAAYCDYLRLALPALPAIAIIVALLLHHISCIPAFHNLLKKYV